VAAASPGPTTRKFRAIGGERAITWAMRSVALILVVWLGVLGARPAEACGFWSMADHEKGLTIGYLINSASIAKGDRRWAAQYFDLEAKFGLRVVAEHAVILDIAGGKLRKRGKVIGSIAANGDVTIGGHTFAIDLTEPDKLDGVMPTWKLVVKRGDTIVLTSDRASSLCAGMHRDPPMTDAEAREEVRRRVIYYLAWRETGA
jgi:hypothetical protein